MYVTDGTNDGGIDGYYIDKEKKTIYFLQAKFRTNEENFQSCEIKFRLNFNMYTKTNIYNLKHLIL